MENVKLIIAWALSPFIIGMMLQLSGWVAWLKRKWRKTALILWATSVAVMLVGSLPVLSYEKSRAKEYRYEPLDLEADLKVDQPVLIIVMGTGFNPDPWLPRNSQVSPTAHARLLEGVRIFRGCPKARLIVSVANDDIEPSEKQAFLDFMVELLALDPARVELFAEAESTEDEADFVKNNVKESEQVVIATTAGHMPRSMDTFEGKGMTPLPAPTGFYFPRDGNPHEKKWKRWIPSEGGIGGTRNLLYESVASLWLKVRGGD